MYLSEKNAQSWRFSDKIVYIRKINKIFPKLFLCSNQLYLRLNKTIGSSLPPSSSICDFDQNILVCEGSNLLDVDPFTTNKTLYQWFSSKSTFDKIEKTIKITMMLVAALLNRHFNYILFNLFKICFQRVFFFGKLH
jgi:hypothetical protein